MTLADLFGKASIQVWGKGFRVSLDTEEFQRYVPHDTHSDYGIEGKLPLLPWGRVLEPLYKVPERDLLSQRCVLVDDNEVISFSFARSTDRYRRPSLVLATAAARVDWGSDTVGLYVSRVVALGVRLAEAYAKVFEGNPDDVARQLRAGGFLTSRQFSLDAERDDGLYDWATVFSEVRRYRGIGGVATPRLLSLGANVALGTRFEAERAQAEQPVDGFFNVTDGAIHPMTQRLVEWVEPPKAEAVEQPRAEPTSDARPVADSLHGIDESLRRLVDLAYAWFDVAVNRGKRKR